MATGFVPGVAHPAADHARLFVFEGQSLAVVRVDEHLAIPVGSAGDGWLYLGACDGAPCFARVANDDAPVPAGSDAMPLRQLHGVLPEADFAIAARALGLTTWDLNHRFCGRCGAPTEPSRVERARVCGACTLAHYPRLSPAVIVLVERNGQALLARNARFPGAFHSCLAGFVEVGETLEETAVREIREEAGIEIASLRYAGSQPWPFTSSLMIGFTAQWAGGQLVPDREEIVDAGWYWPDAVPPLPPRLSIARALIDDWMRRHGVEPAP